MPYLGPGRFEFFQCLLPKWGELRSRPRGGTRVRPLEEHGFWAVAVSDAMGRLHAVDDPSEGAEEPPPCAGHIAPHTGREHRHGQAGGTDVGKDSASIGADQSCS